MKNEADVILDIPSVTLTEVASLEEMLLETQRHWQAVVSAIVYPLLWIEGLTTSDDPLFRAAGSRPGASLNEAARFCKERRIPLWLSLNLDLDPVRSDVVHIKNFFGGRASHACINTPLTLQAIESILRTAHSQLGENADMVFGLLLPIQNLWPVAGREGIIDPSCFCAHCTESLQAEDANIMSRFMKVPSPWNFLLRDTPTGVSHINDFSSSTSPEQLGARVKAHAFYEDFLSEDTEPEALDRLVREGCEAVLAYAKARHNITVRALKRIGETARAVLSKDAAVAAAISDLPYDWLAGTFLDLLDTQPPVDELWIDPSNSAEQPRHAPIRRYIFDRGRYVIDGFLDVIETSISSTQRTLSELAGLTIHTEAVGRAQGVLSRQLPSMMLDLLRKAPDQPANARGFVVPPPLDLWVPRVLEKYAPRPDPVSLASYLENLGGRGE